LKSKVYNAELSGARSASGGENEMNETNLNDLLSAPCMCCGYNGQGYWQRGTHKEDCPFNTIGGEADRKYFVLNVAGKAIQKWYMSR